MPVFYPVDVDLLIVCCKSKNHLLETHVSGNTSAV